MSRFSDAEGKSPYSLARAWVASALVDTETPEAHLDKLATMAALTAWLTRWLPIHIHRALLAGASVEEVADAAGVEFAEATRLWRQWSDGQYALQEAMPTLPDKTAEYDLVDDLIRRAAYDRNRSNPVGNLRLTPPTVQEAG